MRKILLIIAGLGVLGGGGAGAYFLFLQQPAQASISPAHADAGADAHATGDAHAPDKTTPDSPPKFVKLDPLVVPVLDAEGISQIIALDVTFEVKDDAAAAKFETLKPRLRDAMIQNLYGLVHHQVAMEQGALKVGYVKERLGAAATKVMGEGQVTDVLLQMVQQNPI